VNVLGRRDDAAAVGLSPRPDDFQFPRTTRKPTTMKTDDPLAKPKSAYDELIAKISTPDSPVGIDAKYTHAIIIDYLRQISARLDAIEHRLDQGEA
jgi:hypothetical protein